MEEARFEELSEEGTISPINISGSASQELITSSYEEIDSGVESYSVRRKKSTETLEEKKTPEQEKVEKKLGDLSMAEMFKHLMKQMSESRVENLENIKQLNENLNENNKQLNERLNENDKRLDEKFEQTNKNLEKLGDRMDGFEIKIKEVEISLKKEFENQLKINKIEIEKRCDEGKVIVLNMIEENRKEIVVMKTEVEKQEEKLNNVIQVVEKSQQDKSEKLELMITQKQEAIEYNQKKMEEDIKNNSQVIEKCNQQIEQGKKEYRSTVESFTNECRDRISDVEGKIKHAIEVKEREYLRFKDEIIIDVTDNLQKNEDRGAREENRRKDEERIGQSRDRNISQHSQMTKDYDQNLGMYEDTEIKRVGFDRENREQEKQEIRQLQSIEERYDVRDHMYKTGDPILANLIKIKIFSGSGNENPIEYLRTLEELFSLHKYKEQEKLAIACNHLSDHAKDWWRILFDKPTTFENFKYSVLSSFWNESRQDQIRYQVMHEKYQIGKGSYTQFFRNQAVKLRSLSAFAMTENQILMLLRHNFPRNVEQVLIASGCTKLEEAADILNALEMSGVNENRERLWKERAAYQVSNIHVRQKGSNSINRNQVYNVGRYDNRNNIKSDRKGRSPSRKKINFSENQPTTSEVTTIYKNGGVNCKNQKSLN